MEDAGRSARRSSSFWIGMAAVAAAYIAFGRIGLLFAFVQANTTAIWAPTGIAIAVFLLFGYRFWPAIFFGAFITNLITAGTIATSIGIAVGNTCEGLVAAYLVNRFANGKFAFERAPDVVKYAVLAGMIGTMVSPTIGVVSLALGGFAMWSNFGPIWFTWWLGDLGGAILVGPCIILWFLNHRLTWERRKVFEGALLAAVLLLFAFLVIDKEFSILFLFMTPILVWVAFRFERRIVAISVLVMTEVYVIGILRTMAGPSSSAVNQSLVLLQAFMATTFVTVMALAAALGEDREARVRLADFGERVSRENVRDKAILSSIGDGLIVTDRDGKIVLMNPEAESMFGWKFVDIVGKLVVEVISIEDAKGNMVPPGERPITKALTEGKAVATAGVATYYYVRKNGTKFPVALTATPVILDGKIAGAIDLIKDVTLEQEVDRQKNEFVSIAAHQLRTPLSSIKWLIELLLESRLEKAQRKKLADVYESNERLISVVRDLLNITRVESGKVRPKIEPVRMSEMIEATIKFCARDAEEKKIKFQYAPFRANVNVMADRILLGEAFKNILDNAVVYAPRGSSVKIALAVREKEKDCTVTVENGGSAIAELDRPNIFKKFYRGVEAPRVKPGGSGLGLYIARLNVETMGGSIGFDSPIHGVEGVRFYLHFPLAETKMVS